MKTDTPQPSTQNNSLFRVSLKSIILNDAGEVLVVKESGRDGWDMPGGGMEQGESIKEAIARELREEVSLTGDFTYQVIAVKDARYLPPHDLYQMRIIFRVVPNVFEFAPGDDGDEIAFMNPGEFKDSELYSGQKIYEYGMLVKLMSA